MFEIVYRTVSGESESVQQNTKVMSSMLMSLGYCFNLGNLPWRETKQGKADSVDCSKHGWFSETTAVSYWQGKKKKKPRCFKNVKTLPCQYKNNKYAWMTCTIFEEYIHSLDAKMGYGNRKILLFMEHCLVHPENIANLRIITIHFLSPNSTSIHQPMDQGSSVLKQHFHNVSCFQDDFENET
ncbi:hypothetical protein PR048_017455 [Dryococelus australis]|uniref:DDE-1 domain-containing protein n=1 Tax=Dryococelus australis TaxID=614101 RepID=A0ABQ9H9J6_9NEOP|nr:hypothetical protein PR048_017455 [Dryococelus australis]